MFIFRALSNLLQGRTQEWYDHKADDLRASNCLACPDYADLRAWHHDYPSN